MSRLAEIEAAAAAWLVRREGDDWTGHGQIELDRWLDASPDHTVAYWWLEYVWSQTDRLAALRAAGSPPSQARRCPLGSWRSRTRRPALTAGAIAASLVAALLLGPVTPSLGERRYHTAVGGRQTVPLADGTRIELNTATRLRVKLSDDRRIVWLDQGEAYFDIAHDKEHPFLVEAGPRRITVLGTRFSVRREGDRVEVAVIEGRVRVDDQGGGAAAARIIKRGDIAISQDRSTLVAEDSLAQVEDMMSWRSGALTFNQTTLADVVEEFNRYNLRQLVVADPAIADMRIGGRF